MNIGMLAAGTMVGAVGSYSTYMLIGADKSPSPGRISANEILLPTVIGTGAVAVLGGMGSLISTTDVGNTGPAFFSGLALGGAVGWAAAGVTALVKHAKEN